MSTPRGGGKRGDGRPHYGDSERSSGRGGGSGGGSGGSGRGGGGGDNRSSHGGSERGGGGRGSGGHRGGGDNVRGRGRGYGRGGGGRPVEPVKRNVRELYEVPQFKHKVMKKLIKKPGYGKEGTKIKLIANFFQLNVGDKTVYHYDIDIKLVKARDDGLEAGGGDTTRATASTAQTSSSVRKERRLALKENVELIQRLSTEWDAFRGVSYVYDGRKNLYSLKRLKFSGPSDDQYSREVSIVFDGYQEQRYNVMVQYCQEAINLSTINHFYAGVLNEIPQQAFQALEIILQYIPMQILVPIGRSLYTPLTAQEIRDNNMGESAVMTYGHYQSVRLTEVGAAVLIDRKATVLHYSGSLIDFIMNLVPGVHNREQLKRFLFTNDGALINNLNKHLSGLKVITTHIRGERRKCTIDKLVAQRPGEIQFPWTITDPNGSVRTVTTNIVDYYKKQYNITLGFLNIPCVLAKGGRVKRHFPVEICEVCPNQPLPRKLISKDITAQMVRKSGQQLPINRFSKITESAEMIADSSRNLLDEFGVQMSTNPMQVDGRVLAEPKCDGNDKRVKEGKQLNKWIFVNLSARVEEPNMNSLRRFVENLTAVAVGMGITIGPLTPQSLLRGIAYQNQETIRKAFNAAKTRCPDVQMIMFCIPSINEIYHNIKYYGDIVFGIITQCIKDDNLLDTPRGYETNILLKINSKLDGKNSIIPQKPRILTANPTIVIGCDVSHPAPADRMLSSVAACVGSYDRDFSKYSASITVQERSRDEIITKFGQMITELLEQFKEKNKKTLPQTIIIFRDGVSESQFETVLDREYDLLVKACKGMGISQPKITFVIVQKRHHTRFLPLDPNDASGRAGNIPPGTVVDNTITNPVLFEYYLCSHYGLQGTSRPTKYVVLKDDNNLSADEMEKLSYYLCFTYARCNKSISIPTPVMYAHLAAYRSKLHIVAQTIDSGAQTTEQRAQSEQSSADELNEKVKVNEALRARLYYC